MRKYFKRKKWMKKFFITFFLIILFILGRKIALPGINSQNYYFQDDYLLAVSSSISGGNLAELSIFSLGLGPWMYSVILMRLFSFGKRKKAISPTQLMVLQNLLMLIIAIIQSLGLAIELQKKASSVGQLETILSLSLILIAGSFLISWLANMNTAFGIGGPAMLVVVSMLLAQFSNIPLFVTMIHKGYFKLIMILLMWSLLSMFMILFFDRAEYRVPVARISIHNKLSEKAYIPIKVNASGGMPLMYVYTLLMLPQYLAMLLNSFYPGNGISNRVINLFSLNNITGIIIFTILIIVLAISFSFTNIDPTTLAEQLREVGDFIPEKRPGRQTEKYLKQLAWFFGSFSGLFLAILSILPLILTMGNSELQKTAQMTGIVMMLTGLMMSIIEEINIGKLAAKYKPLFESE